MLLVALLVVLVPSVTAQCSFSKGDISARWQVANDELTVEFVNKKIGNNQWTAIGFGPDMSNLEVVVVKIQGNKPSLVTGHTDGYDAPKLDTAANVVPKLLSFNTNQLTLRFTRPLSSNGPRKHSLENCQKWNFVKEGTLEDGKIGLHKQAPSSMTFLSSSPLSTDGSIEKHTSPPLSIVVCPGQCTQLFETRDVLTDPVPQNAIYNNRQSSRFDGLHGYYRL
ncbi:hypothetical protein V3C99_004268 [Haemonchus contortus]